MLHSKKQARQLGKLFNIKKATSMRLPSIGFTTDKKEIIKIQKEKMEELTRQIQDLQGQAIGNQIKIG